MTQEKPSTQNWRSIMSETLHNQRIQIFCFTYAGGTASFFDSIESDLAEFDLVKLEYAGHGKRHKEPLPVSFEDIADDLYPRIKQAFNGGKYALFGYSMGTITLIEVLKRILDDSSMPKPESVFLAAHEPHSKRELAGFDKDELDDWVKERTIKFGAVPEKLIDNRVFWRTYLPLYRSDYSMIGDYRFEDLEIKTDIPAIVFYSETDTPFREISKWNKYFIGSMAFFQFDGTHFFIREHHQEMAVIIRSLIER